jgi:hypothetical protein
LTGGSALSALVPDLRYPVAELAVGVADQVGDGGVVVRPSLELRDRRGVVVAVVVA